MDQSCDQRLHRWRKPLEPRLGPDGRKTLRIDRRWVGFIRAQVADFHSTQTLRLGFGFARTFRSMRVFGMGVRGVVMVVIMIVVMIMVVLRVMMVVMVRGL